MLRPLKGSGYKTEETNIRKFNCNREYNTYSVNKNYVTSSWLCFKTLQKKNPLPQISSEHDAPTDCSGSYEVVWVMDLVHFGDSKAVRFRRKINILEKSEYSDLISAQPLPSCELG